MRQFLKFVIATITGLLLFLIITFFVFAAILGSAFKKEVVTVKDNSILKMEFNFPLAERSDNNPFRNLDFNNLRANNQPGLYDMIKCVQKAAKDDNIKGIYLDMDKFEGGYASIEELRQSLVEFKKSNKFILAYAEEYSTKAYYLASVADSVFLHPQGAVDFKGLFTQLAFFKGTLDKLEIEPEIIRHGKFKSAIEPFIYDKMSPENKEQIATFVNAIWNTMLTQIAQGRNITTQQLELIADSLLAENAQKALDLKLVDKLLYKDEFDNVLAEKSGISETSKLKFITLGKYNETAEPKTGKPFAKDKIAVIYATGEIVSGKGQADEVGSETLAKAIKNATEDANVKAIVLRVNSPGGSALASDVIWRETKLAKAKKPFIVSMGNVAASGGYYISCLADTIVAQHNTITGSIGVFGLLLNAQKMFNNKLGLTFDTYKTGPYADLGLPTRPLTSMERVKMQNSVEQVYDVFTKHVAEGRNISQANVDSIGQGRVWSGVDAMGIRLIDVYGGLNDAIAIAARAAKIDNYRIKELPEQKDALREILDDMKGETEMALMPQAVKQAANVYRFMQNKNPKDKIQARLPFGLEVE